MPRQCLPVCVVTPVGHVEIARGADQDAVDRRVLSMIALRKQMMFDLVVEASGKPGQPAITRAEIGGRAHLMNGPVGFEMSGMCIRLRKGAGGGHVRELKYRRQRDA